MPDLSMPSARLLAFSGLIFGIFSLAVPPSLLAASTFSVKTVTVQDRKAVFATVEPVDVVTARTRIGGTLVSLSVDEGSLVKAGDIIGRVLDPKLGLRMDAVQARIDSLRSRLKLARIDLARAEKLRASGTVSQARLDKARTGLKVAEHSLAAARAELSVIKEQRAEGDIAAPAGGRVTKVPLTRGAVVLAGETVAVIAAKGYILRMYLPERHARFIKNGDPVLVGQRDGGMKKGYIRQVYPKLRKGRVVADVEVGGLGDFFVGERVPVYVSTGERQTFVVPEEYLFRRFGLIFVKLRDGDKIVVQPGLKEDGGIEILSGLNEGDVLAPPGPAAGRKFKP